jgi:hypothetical protein
MSGSVDVFLRYRLGTPFPKGDFPMAKGRPQQQEISRSGHTPVDQDNMAEQAAEEKPPADKDGKKGARVPRASRPGHHPSKDQDKPPQLGGAGHGGGKRKRRT